MALGQPKPPLAYVSEYAMNYSMTLSGPLPLPLLLSILRFQLSALLPRVARHQFPPHRRQPVPQRLRPHHRRVRHVKNRSIWCIMIILC